MSRWHGKHGKGARRDIRAQLRVEAEERNARTPVDRRRAARAAAPRRVSRVVFRRIARPRPHFVWHATARVGAGL